MACDKLRAVSSAGERLVYTERAGGSIPSLPTITIKGLVILLIPPLLKGCAFGFSHSRKCPRFLVCSLGIRASLVVAFLKEIISPFWAVFFVGIGLTSDRHAHTP